MADDKDESQQTEQPTAKRLEQARENGDVVKSGDVVIKLDGVGIHGVDDLIRALDHNRIGRTVEMEVLRLGRLRSFEIHPVERKPSAR